MNFIASFSRNTVLQIFVFGAFFMGLYYFSFYDDGAPLKKEIQNVRSQIQTAQTNISKAQGDLENKMIFKREVETDEKVVKDLLNYTPESLTFNEISIIITNEALTSGVNIDTKRDGRVEDIPDTNYQTLEIEVNIISSFSQLMVFLSKLTEQKRVLIVQAIDIQVDEKTDLISAKLALLAYRYEEPNNPEESNQES